MCEIELNVRHSETISKIFSSHEIISLQIFLKKFEYFTMTFFDHLSFLDNKVFQDLNFLPIITALTFSNKFR